MVAPIAAQQVTVVLLQAGTRSLRGWLDSASASCHLRLACATREKLAASVAGRLCEPRQMQADHCARQLDRFAAAVTFVPGQSQRLVICHRGQSCAVAPSLMQRSFAAPVRCDTGSLQVHISGCVGWIAPTLMDGSWQTVGGKKKDKQAEKKRSKTNEAEPLKQSAAASDGAPSAFAALDAWKRDGELPLQGSRRNMFIKPRCTEYFSTLTANMK